MLSSARAPAEAPPAGAPPAGEEQAAWEAHSASVLSRMVEFAALVRRGKAHSAAAGGGGGSGGEGEGDPWVLLSRRPAASFASLLGPARDPRPVDEVTGAVVSESAVAGAVAAWSRAGVGDVVDPSHPRWCIRKTLRWWGVREGGDARCAEEVVSAEAEEAAAFAEAAERERRRAARAAREEAEAREARRAREEAEAREARRAREAAASAPPRRPPPLLQYPPAPAGGRDREARDAPRERGGHHYSDDRDYPRERGNDAPYHRDHAAERGARGGEQTTHHREQRERGGGGEYRREQRGGDGGGGWAPRRNGRSRSPEGARRSRSPPHSAHDSRRAPHRSGGEHFYRSDRDRDDRRGAAGGSGYSGQRR